MSVAGSIKSVTVAGFTLNPVGDSSGKFPVSNFETEATATAGEPIIKYSRKVNTIEGIEFAVTPSQAESIGAIANRTIPYDTTIVLMDDSIYQGQSIISAKERDSMEGKMGIDFHPVDANGWTQINKT